MPPTDGPDAKNAAAATLTDAASFASETDGAFVWSTASRRV